MYSFRRFAFLLALCLPAFHAVPAQSLSSSSNPDATASAAQNQDQGQQPAPTQGELSVQARIRARRAQRRAAAIHEVYDHLYEGYVGAGYTRFRLPSPLQRVNEYSWNAGFTRYYNERLGVTLDGRGTYGTAFIEPIELIGTDSALTKPAISQYAVLIGPNYRFYLQPKYSISARFMVGYARGDFTGDTNGEGTLGVLYPDGGTYAANASIFAEYNVAPNIGVRVAPEYYLTGFGSSQQNSLGFTAGIVYRFGRQ
jgi:hypothetical protein